MSRLRTDRTTFARLAAPVSRNALAAALLLAASGAARAEVPGEFIGTWSTDPPRCKQENGKVDVLTVTRTGFDFYEIGCDVGRPAQEGDATRFPARCYKGGGPKTKGMAVLRRLGPDKVDVSLRGFMWTTDKPETFRRCGSH